jgi:hypothetical protein
VLAAPVVAEAVGARELDRGKGLLVGLAWGPQADLAKGVEATVAGHGAPATVVDAEVDVEAARDRFIDTYRSYVINYNLGRSLVERAVEQAGGDSADARWNAFTTLLSTPRVASTIE